jgi:hypothetical protein
MDRAGRQRVKACALGLYLYWLGRRHAHLQGVCDGACGVDKWLQDEEDACTVNSSLSSRAGDATKNGLLGDRITLGTMRAAKAAPATLP